MVLPTQPMDNGVEVVTNKLLSDSVVTAPIKSPDVLANALHSLILSKDKREAMSKLISAKK